MKNTIVIILCICLFKSTNVFSQSTSSKQSVVKVSLASERNLSFPFLWGAQYYRAPTPSRENWDADLKHMSDLGFTDVKFWLQWRWNHVAPDKFYFDDLDELMNIAEKYNLRVTLNFICNVSPIWLFNKYPDAKQIRNDGHSYESETTQARQIGGNPGPCLINPGALHERQKFFREAILHLKKHKNLAFWDVWSEPGFSHTSDIGAIDKLRCYCSHCKKAFTVWLKEKYTTIERLNDVWGRNYANWNEIELPKSASTIKDFVDWCDFHSYVMTKEAKWRLGMTKELDPTRVSYLHVTPNTATAFNPVTTCVNDFEVAKLCDVFAASMGNDQRVIQMLSAGEGKICYSAENFINGGSIAYHQSIVTLNDLLNDLLPQMVMGIKGFLFWQFRPELLGIESPAWGLVNPDGSDRVVTKAVVSFWKTFKPYTELLMKSSADKPDVAIWKSMKNEVFNYSTFGNFKSYNSSITAYTNFLSNHSYNFCYVNSEQLDYLNNIKVLIMPTCYYLTRQEADAIDAWVRKGGVLFSEAHLGGYNDNLGRHSYVIPGFGLDKKWGSKEFETSSTYLLKFDEKQKNQLKNLTADGGLYVPITMKDSSVLLGAWRFAKLQASDADVLGSFNNDYPSILSKKIGDGKVYYCGTNIGEGSEKNSKSFNTFLIKLMQDSQVEPVLKSNVEKVWVKKLSQNGKMNFIVIRNLQDRETTVCLQFKGKAKGLFSGLSIESNKDIILPKGYCDFFVVN